MGGRFKGGWVKGGKGWWQITGSLSVTSRALVSVVWFQELTSIWRGSPSWAKDFTFNIDVAPVSTSKSSFFAPVVARTTNRRSHLSSGTSSAHPRGARITINANKRARAITPPLQHTVSHKNERSCYYLFRRYIGRDGSCSQDGR